jgi:hypothetical protein
MSFVLFHIPTKSFVLSNIPTKSLVLSSIPQSKSVEDDDSQLLGGEKDRSLARESADKPASCGWNVGGL